MIYMQIFIKLDKLYLMSQLLKIIKKIIKGNDWWGDDEWGNDCVQNKLIKNIIFNTNWCNQIHLNRWKHENLLSQGSESLIFLSTPDMW